MVLLVTVDICHRFQKFQLIKTVESRILTERLYILHHNEIYLGMTPLKKTEYYTFVPICRSILLKKYLLKSRGGPRENQQFFVKDNKFRVSTSLI